MTAMRAALLLLLVACGRDPARAPKARVSLTPDAGVAAAAAVAPPSDGCTLVDHPLQRAQPARLVAIGDVHGDLAATRHALRLGGAIDADDRWIGGELVVVQTGDILDRGSGEQEILELFERLEGEAAKAGGAFVWLLGNHELMNSAGDFRYVTDGGWADFADAPGVDPARPDLKDALAGATDEVKARAAAFLPGGPYADMFAGQDVATIVGDAVFSHAGFLSTWTADVTAMNRSARCWLDGQGATPAVLEDSDGPVWTRAWGGAEVDCARLREVLGALGVARMVVGHTPQDTGINSACDGALWRIDTGMSSAYGGPVQVLELTPTGGRALSD